MSLSTLAVNRPITVVMTFIAIALFGLFAAVRLPIEQFPEVEIPFVAVGIPYPNASAEEVERNVLHPVEEVLSTMSGIKDMYGIARPDMAFVQLHLDMGGDVTGKGIEAKELIEGIRHRLPSSVRHIYLRQEDPNSQPVMNLTISGPTLIPSRSYELLDTRVRGTLERVPGVNSAELFGVDRRYVRIALKPDRVAAHRLDFNDIQRRLQAENFLVSAGTVDDAGNRWQVRPLGQFENVAAIGALPMNDRGLTLADIADIDTTPTEDQKRQHVNGQPAVGVSVFKRPEANLVAVSSSIAATIAELGEEPALTGLTFLPLANMGDMVVQSLNDVRNSGFLGALLSFLVLLFFLRSFGPSLLIVATVPLAISITLGVMYFMGLTLNILSLVGLMLSVGLLVDNAVVVSESIHLRRHNGEARLAASALGASEVTLAIVAGTLTTVIVFVPSFMTDIQMVATIQQNIAIPLCVSLLASLFVAQTLLPAALARMPVSPTRPSQGWVGALQRAYARAIEWTLRYRVTSLLLTVVLGAAGYGAYTQIDVEMNPQEEEQRLSLTYSIRGSDEIDAIEAVVKQVENYLLANRARFEIDNTFTSYSTDWASTLINLKRDSTQSTKIIEKQILEELPMVPNVRFYFGGHRMGRGGGGGGRGGGEEGGWGVRLIGESTTELQRIAEDVITVLDRVPAVRNARSSDESNRQEIQLHLHKDLMSQYGLTADAVARAVSVALGGSQLRRGLQKDGQELDIWMELEGKEFLDVNTLRNLPLILGDGETVSLQTVADLQFAPSLRGIRRQNRETSINVSFEVQGVPFAAGQQIVNNVMKQFELPAGYRWEMGQQARDEEEQFIEMAVNMLFAIALVYMVMAALFESVLFPVAVLMAIGYSLVGVFGFFWVSGTPLTAMALTGMLLLMGIVVNNGIVLLDRISQLRRQGIARNEAIVASGRDRLRPILMTVGTTVAGMLPLAVGDVRIGGEGPSYYPMARALMSGLVFSTLVTLLFLPLMYVLLDDLKSVSLGFWRQLRGRLIHGWRAT